MATLAVSAFGNLHFDNTLGALYVGTKESLTVLLGKKTGSFLSRRQLGLRSVRPLPGRGTETREC